MYIIYSICTSITSASAITSTSTSISTSRACVRVRNVRLQRTTGCSACTVDMRIPTGGALQHLLNLEECVVKTYHALDLRAVRYCTRCAKTRNAFEVCMADGGKVRVRVEDADVLEQWMGALRHNMAFLR